MLAGNNLSVATLEWAVMPLLNRVPPLDAGSRAGRPGRAVVGAIVIVGAVLGMAVVFRLVSGRQGDDLEQTARNDPAEIGGIAVVEAKAMVGGNGGAGPDAGSPAAEGTTDALATARARAAHSLARTRAAMRSLTRT